MAKTYKFVISDKIKIKICTEKDIWNSVFYTKVISLTDNLMLFKFLLNNFKKIHHTNVRVQLNESLLFFNAFFVWTAKKYCKKTV